MSVTEQFASVYRRGEHYFVHANAQTVAGFWLASEPAMLLPIDCTSQALGEAVYDALRSCAYEVATPSRDDYRALHAPLLAVAKVQSWSALQRTAILCEVWLRGSEIALEPTRNGGLHGDNRGYHHLPEHRVTFGAGKSAADLGVAVRSALGKCR